MEKLLSNLKMMPLDCYNIEINRINRPNTQVLFQVLLKSPTKIFGKYCILKKLLQVSWLTQIRIGLLPRFRQSYYIIFFHPVFEETCTQSMYMYQIFFKDFAASSTTEFPKLWVEAKLLSFCWGKFRNSL